MAVPIHQPGTRKASFAKSQFLLEQTIGNIFQHHSVSEVLFVTLTFPIHITSPKQAHKYLNSLLNKIRERYGSYLWVLGCHDSGRIHYHMIVPVKFDAHGGTDLSAWSNPFTDHPGQRDREQYNSMNPTLRAESDWWTGVAPRFGFGRVQVAPIYSTAEGVLKYLLRQGPDACDVSLGNVKNVRFWYCSRDLKVGTTKFAWNSLRGWQNRERLKGWAAERGCMSYEELTPKLGSRWGYEFINDISRIMEGFPDQNSPGKAALAAAACAGSDEAVRSERPTRGAEGRCCEADGGGLTTSGRRALGSDDRDGDAPDARAFRDRFLPNIYSL